MLAFFLPNDPNNNRYSRQYGLAKPVFLNTQLKLANIPVPAPRSGAETVETQADSLELTVAIMQAIAHECADHDCRFAVMKFGRFLDWDRTSYVEDEQKFEQLLQGLLPEVPYLDLDEAFLERSITTEQLRVGNDDGHWNAEGHRITAEILDTFLSDKGLR